MSIKPPALRKGSIIGVVAPANSADTITKKSWDIGVKFLKNRGYNLVFGKYLMTRFGHTSGTINQRTEDFMEVYEKADVILTVYGGFNSHEILDFLDYTYIRRNPKAVLGYSDRTALSIGIYAQTGLVGFISPSFSTFSDPFTSSFTIEHFFDVVTGKTNIKVPISSKWSDKDWSKKPYPYFKPFKWRTNPGWKILRSGKAEGLTVGGNLSTIALLCGTKYLPDMKNKILFFEDDHEAKPWYYARYVFQLKQAGVFDKIKGLVIGRSHSKAGFTKKDSIEMIIKEALSEYDFPIISEIDFGHTEPAITLPIGIKCSVNTQNKQIEYLEPAVKP